MMFVLSLKKPTPVNHGTLNDEDLAAINRWIVVWQSIRHPVLHRRSRESHRAARCAARCDTVSQVRRGGDTSESDDDDQLSIADAASMACASGEDSRAMAKDDQDAGSSRAVVSDNQSVLCKSSARAASTGEKVPTTSPAAERSYESAVSVVQRPLPQTVSTRASSAATVIIVSRCGSL